MNTILKADRRVLILTGMTIAVVLPIIFFGVPNGADLPNHLRFVQPFYDSIRGGNWHPGWLAESNNGFGDPRFRFYPPGFYYLWIAARVLTGNWYAGSVVTLVFLSVAGALGTYFWVRAFCTARTAMWAGILYAVAPFHLSELYQGSLLAEYAAGAVLPFAFAFTERICRDRKLVDVAGLAASFALLVLTHLPLTVLGTISLAIYALLRIEYKTFRPTVARLAMAIAVGLAASSFYWATMLAELHWIKGNTAEPNPYYDYRLNFLFSPSALANRNTWYANLVALAMIAFLLPGIVLVRRLVRDRVNNKELIAAATVTVTSFIFATAVSRPLWAVIPKLSEVQFPWRWLAITSLCGSVVVAASLSKWIEIFRAHVRPRDMAIAFAFLLSLGFVVSQVIINCDYLSRASFETMARDVRGGPSFKDWLPVNARSLLNLNLTPGKVDAGSRSVIVDSWEGEHRQFKVAAGPEPTARVRTYYYPHWKATANGQTLATRAADDGAILIFLPPASADITLTFQEPARVRYAEVLSLLAWLAITAAVVSRFARSTQISHHLLVAANSR
ncbi:MAG TPA: 6-pyruvoyl-tetrahydropterin synthase-related protein [Pyrinomonadaceae bacterium]